MRPKGGACVYKWNSTESMEAVGRPLEDEQNLGRRWEAIIVGNKDWAWKWEDPNQNLGEPRAKQEREEESGRKASRKVSTQGAG
jgi:hypothetical protein